MSGNLYIVQGTCAASPGTLVDILGEGNFTAKNTVIINNDASLTITISGIGSGDLSLFPGEYAVIPGSIRRFYLVEATGAATFRVIASDSAVPAAQVQQYTLTSGDIADESVPPAKLAASVAGNGLAGGAGVALSVDLNELVAAVLDPATDSLPFLDATGNASRVESVDDFVTAIAGAGLANSASTLIPSINGLPATAIASADSIAFEDADTLTKKATLTQLGDVLAGAGLTNTAGVLSVVNAANGGLAVAADTLAVDLSDLSSAAVDPAADSVVIIDANDANGSRQESVADLMTAVAGNGLAATAGVLAVLVDPTLNLGGLVSAPAGLSLDIDDLDAAVVTPSADFIPFATAAGASQKVTIADFVAGITGEGLAAAAGEMAINLSTVTPAVVDVAADSIAFLDATDGTTKLESVADLVAGIAGAGVITASGGTLDITDLGLPTAKLGDVVTPALSIGVEAANVILLTAQMQDAAGTNVAAVTAFRAHIVGELAATYTLTDGGAGTKLGSYGAEPWWIGETDVTGLAEINVTDVAGASAVAVIVVVEPLGQTAVATPCTFVGVPSWIEVLFD